jgi:hypothetical protein
MKKCKAFYPIAGSRTAWIPCVRKAEEGTGFCRRHGDAIFGVMLGAIVYEKPVEEGEEFCRVAEAQEGRLVEAKKCKSAKV